MKFIYQEKKRKVLLVSPRIKSAISWVYLLSAILLVFGLVTQVWELATPFMIIAFFLFFVSDRIVTEEKEES